jgi:uncharacterized repeat protein (TIGR03803 family)
MKANFPRFSLAAFIAVSFTLVFTFTTAAYAQYTETMLFNFTGGAYGGDANALVRDASGNFYSTFGAGGVTNKACDGFSCGLIVKVSPNASGVYTETILHTYTGDTSGWDPTGLVQDAHGNLYGSTDTGGTIASSCRFGCGVIFELKPLSAGGWAYTVLYSFADAGDGLHPVVTLIDSAGNLYGYANGGPNNEGTIFQLSNSGGTWTKNILYAFAGGADGILGTPMFLDASGNLFGTSREGGNLTSVCFGVGCGYVFELTPTTTGSWTKTILYTFNGSPDGAGPSFMVPDGAGNLFGITGTGGTGTNSNCIQFNITGCGTLFELSPDSSGGWTETVQHSFNYALDGAFPNDLVIDSEGNLYVDVSQGTPGGSGAVLKFTLGSDSIWQYTTLHSFANGNGGSRPYATILDGTGNVYGAVVLGGTKKEGGIFRLSPPGATK